MKIEISDRALKRSVDEDESEGHHNSFVVSSADILAGGCAEGHIDGVFLIRNDEPIKVWMS
jgi:hypothetical protein